MRQSVSFIAVVACIALSAGCDNSGDSSTSPTPVPLTTETFTGTVDPMGSVFHSFTVAQGGELDITLTAVGPPATIFMGLGIGTLSSDSASCSLDSRFTLATHASTTPQIPVSAGAGRYCVQLFDIGNQTAQVSYTITVAHS